MHSHLTHEADKTVQTNLAWSLNDAVQTRYLILENLNDRSVVVDLMLGFVARNFQGRAFSVRSLRNALGLDASIRIGEKNTGDKITNLLYDATRRGHTKTLLANIGEFEGVTHYSLTDAGWDFYGDADTDKVVTIEPMVDIYSRINIPSYYGGAIGEGHRVYNPLSESQAPIEPAIPTTLTLAGAIEVIRKLNGKVKSLEATINELYDLNVDLSERLEAANALQIDYVNIDEDVQQILRELA